MYAKVWIEEGKEFKVEKNLREKERKRKEKDEKEEGKERERKKKKKLLRICGGSRPAASEAAKLNRKRGRQTRGCELSLSCSCKQPRDATTRDSSEAQVDKGMKIRSVQFRIDEKISKK